MGDIQPAIDLLDHSENTHLDKICEEVCRTMGGDIQPDEVKSVIETINTGGHMLHGIKDEHLVKNAMGEGVRPLTPEGGQVSFWTSGVPVFLSELGDGRLSTYDTTFFHYGHSASQMPGHYAMTIAITNRDLLRAPSFNGNAYSTAKRRISDAIRPNGYLQISDAVPRDAMCVLRVELNPSGTKYTPRQYAQIAEQQMFKLLERALAQGYKGGETCTVKCRIGNAGRVDVIPG